MGALKIGRLWNKKGIAKVTYAETCQKVLAGSAGGRKDKKKV